MTEIKCRITNNKFISAIYFALLQCGYDYHLIGKDKSLVSEFSVFYKKENFPFFSYAKQNTCGSYSYWPRAALLETACYYINTDIFEWNNFGEYKNFIMKASNLTSEERNDNFLKWVYEFPPALKEVVQNRLFKSYLDWEDKWISKQNENHKDDLATLKKRIEFCAEYYGTAYTNLEILLSPIKCFYSCDHHFTDKTFVFSSGNFSIDGITHEFLHHIIHPIIERNKAKIINSRCDFFEIDPSYYLSGGDTGKLNAFEEQTVRIITQRFADNLPVKSIDRFISDMLK